MTFWTCCVGSALGAETCDEALDLSREGASKLLAEFADKRPNIKADGTDDAGNVVLPVKPGKALTLFCVEPLSRAALAFAMTATTAETRYARAFSLSCWRYQAPDEPEKSCTPTRSDEFRQAPDEWIGQVFDALGQHVINEIGKVAVDRAHLGPKASKRGGFSLPSGLMLPR